jgi:hypothetical protein
LCVNLNQKIISDSVYLVYFKEEISFDADNDVVYGLDVVELVSCHSSFREVEDVIVVLQQLFRADVHRLDVIGNDAI